MICWDQLTSNSSISFSSFSDEERRNRKKQNCRTVKKITNSGLPSLPVIMDNGGLCSVAGVLIRTCIFTEKALTSTVAERFSGTKQAGIVPSVSGNVQFDGTYGATKASVESFQGISVHVSTRKKTGYII